MIHTKRIYELPNPNDGFRMLIDRLWPRGFSKADAAIDAWMKEVAPSTQLRKWFAHDPAKWNEFKLLYAQELDSNPEAIAELSRLAKTGVVTLLYAARDVQHNHAPVLQEYLQRKKT